MYRFHVPGMTCGGCARAITNAILEVDPAAEVSAEPSTHAVTVWSWMDEAVIVAALVDAGYRPEQPGQTSHS
ncbi:heavy-metal-associated domain-containing protein [Sphingomonas jeddahensis]|uniref:Heavy-metal-associated domain protein n=1 Tax=Sphingomonas jeddahensis TaxID=1915074 RepID=A0A1V2EUB6_9SPHN|nr:heavy-metal-associated domain-containing protein [Sphingomonas jeddahensis]ONF95734.1 Heavy-metal-associated domain protein [Sphingomonas jeddahensis]